MIKFSILASLSLFYSGMLQAQPRLNKIWQTDTVLSVPESVLQIKEDNTLYVSLIGPGNTAEIDGNGKIAKLDLKGNILAPAWASGLNSPKGMGRYEDNLYVADLKELVIINLKSGKIENKINFPDAGMLNDVSIDEQGAVFVSDSKGGKIYQVVEGKPSVYLDGLTNPNGVLAANALLYFLDSGVLYEVDKQKQVNKIAEGMEKSTDGIQLDGENYIVSCWAGVIYYITKDGKVSTLLDSRSTKMNTADFEFDHETRTLYLPTFFKNQVLAFQLE